MNVLVEAITSNFRADTVGMNWQNYEHDEGSNLYLRQREHIKTQFSYE